MTAIAALLALAAAATCFATPGARPATPWMTAQDTVTADGELVWTVDYTLHNPLETGFFPDSFFVDFVDRDAGIHRGPRATTDRLDPLLKGLQPVSGFDSLQASYFSPIRFERGSLTLRMYGHTATGTLPMLSHTSELMPGPFGLDHPSELLAAGSAKVETIVLAAGNPEERVPGILLVHDEETNARRLLGVARSLRVRGYAVVLVSMPGFGLSSGPADWCGPRTLAALETGFRRLSELPGVDASNLVLWGSSRGATAVALLAESHPTVRAIILEGGTYDLQGLWSSSDATTRALIEKEAGRGETALRARSPLRRVSAIRCPVLMLHGELDETAPVAQARAFESALRAAGAVVDVRYVPERAHQLPPAITRAVPTTYLRKLFGR